MIKKTHITRIFMPIFFVLFMLNQSGGVFGDEIGRKAYRVPDYLASISQPITAFLLALLCMVGLYELFYRRQRIFAPLVFLGFAFFVLFVFSVAFMQEYFRYFFYFLMSFCFCSGVVYCLKKETVLSALSWMPPLLWSFLLASVFYAYLNIETHPRISGFLLNPNTFGLALLGSAALYSLAKQRLSIDLLMFMGACLVLVVMTGSRLAAICFVLISPFLFRLDLSVRKLIYVFPLLLLLCALLFAVFYEFILSFRAFQVGASVTDSGRSIIWDRALNVIWLDPITGSGMDVVHTLGITNIHNSYLRVVTMVGIPASIIFFLLFFMSLLFVLLNRGVDVAIKAFFSVVPLLLFAEDYIVAVVGIFSFFFWFFMALAWKCSLESKLIVVP